MSEILERAAREMIEHPPVTAPTAHEVAQRLATRRHRRVATFAAVMLVAATVGLVAISRRDTGTASSGSPVADGWMHCDDYGCHGFNRLPVLDGAADYYAGPVSLGTPTVNSKLFDPLLRCVTLDAAGTGCTKVEGIAGVAPVSYPTDITHDTTERSGESYAVNIGTTFTDISPDAYAPQWAGTTQDPSKPFETTTVRGHPAIRFTNNGSPALAWTERPGVLVWVTVPPEQVEQLDSIAAAVRRVPGPATIQSFVVVPGTGTPWGNVGTGNNGSALLIARLGDEECVGNGFIGSCMHDIDAQVYTSRGSGDGDLIVTGATPANVTNVRVSGEFGPPTNVSTFAFGNYRTRFFAVTLHQDRPTTVEWLARDGATLATSTTVGASTSALGVTGTRISTQQIGGVLVDLSADVDPHDVNSPNGKYQPGDQAVLCVYLHTLDGQPVVVCGDPAQLTVWATWHGLVFGSVGADVATVQVDGTAVELQSTSEIADRRFFVATGTTATMLDGNGATIAVAEPVAKVVAAR